VTAAQLLARIKKQTIPPAILLLGPEAYERRRLREALAATVGPEGVTDHDLASDTLAEVVDDARSLSLFASERLIWVANAEDAMPRGKAAESDDEGESGSSDTAPLQRYMKDPTPGVTLVIEAIRFEFEGDDKRKQDRVRKFYGAIPEVVELKRFSVADARNEAEALARKAGLRIDAEALDSLVEALGADVARIVVEVEKLSLFAGARQVQSDDIAALVPDARASTIFVLVGALGRRDRRRALEALDTLTQEGIYLPLALAFLSTQFRMALAAREANLKSSQQIQSHFTRQGMMMYGSRADQIYQTVSKFTKAQLESAISLIYQADKGMRDLRPDDRTVMERLILDLVR
jgi:DNA polymerase-3 subunit delta